MISIIIPTYNEAACIEQTLENILSLKGEADFEIIVSDGKSTDNTLAISQNYAKTIITEKCKAVQLNRASEQARGDIIFFGDNGIFVKKDVFNALGWFKEILIMEDYDFSIRMRSKFKVRVIQEPK